MKKITKILFMVCALFLLSSCKKDEPLEGEIIELNIYELIELFDNDSKLMFLALNDNYSDSSKLYSEVESYQKITGNYVYFIDTTNIKDIEAEYFNILTNESATTPKLYVLDNGVITFSSDANITYQELNSKLNNTKFSFINMDGFKEKRDNYFNKGLDNLEKGLIGDAYGEIYMAIPKEEAKEKIKNDNIFNLLNSWEYFYEDKNTCEYLSLQFTKGSSMYYQSSYVGKCSNFDKTKLKKNKYSYYYDNDKILSKKENQENYQESFIINELDENNLNITIKNKNYNLVVSE